MLLLPLSYQPALQTITAASKASKNTMSPTELIAFFTEEVYHHVIAEDCANWAELALYKKVGNLTNLMNQMIQSWIWIWTQMTQSQVHRLRAVTRRISPHKGGN